MITLTVFQEELLKTRQNNTGILHQALNAGKVGGAFDSAKNHKHQRRKRQSVTAKREKSQTPKFV